MKQLYESRHSLFSFNEGAEVMSMTMQPCFPHCKPGPVLRLLCAALLMTLILPLSLCAAPENLLDQDWEWFCPGTGTLKRLPSGTYEYSRNDAKYPLYNRKGVPVVPGKRYCVKLEIGKLDAGQRVSLVLGFPGNKGRKPDYLYGSFKKDSATTEIVFTADPNDKVVRIHVNLKQGRLEIKKIEITEVKPYSPTACYAPGSFSADEVEQIRKGLPEKIRSIEQRIETVSGKLASAPGTDAFFRERVAKRLEIARRLVEYVKWERKLDTTDSILFAQRAVDDFELLSRYFDNEFALNVERSRAKEEVWSIRDFGAKGDGIADDSPAFQQALEKAKKHRGFLKLRVPRGRYRLAGMMSIK